METKMYYKLIFNVCNASILGKKKHFRINFKLKDFLKNRKNNSQTHKKCSKIQFKVMKYTIAP
jgi:hypothetical protein